MKRKRIKEYRHVRMLYSAIFEQTPEEWLELPVEARVRFQREWDFLRKMEEIELYEKAKFLKLAIYFTLFMTALSGISMMILMILSNGNVHYYRTITAFEIQMLSMLVLHLYYVLWRWLWSRKLEWLALSIPIEFQ